MNSTTLAILLAVPGVCACGQVSSGPDDASADDVDAAAGLDAPAAADAGETDAMTADAMIDAAMIDAAMIDAPLIDAAPPIDARPIDAPIPHVIFVTGGTFTGRLGGLAGADARCQAAAANVGLGGTYRALLADASSSLQQRIVITGPVRNVLGATLAADRAAFFGNNLPPNNVTEQGTVLTMPTVAWISSGGFLSCDGWDDETPGVSGGLTFVTANQWTTLTANTSCNASPRLQCISQ